MTAYEQMIVLLIFICLGILIGCSLETFRHIGRHYRRNVFIVYTLETLFWISQTAILFFIVWKLYNGNFRIYFILAIICGLQLYNLFVKKFYLPFMHSVLKGLSVLYHAFYALVKGLFYWPIYVTMVVILFACRVILFPFKLLFYWIISLLPKKVYKNISQIGVKCSTILNKYLKN